MLEKKARKPSSDPVQEKLRQNKALWNKDVSAFVNDLIHLKKMMNGWPSKFFKERSRIADPVPADPATIIGSLANDFQDLVQRGNSLVAEQLAYSKVRKKKQPKAPGAPLSATPATPTAPEAPPSPTTPVAPDLSKQLAAFEQKYALVAEASNPVTRFFARLLNPTIGVGEAARIRRYRMSLLKACVKSYRDLNKLQVEIVRSSPKSINTANQQLQQAWNSWILVARGFQTYKMNMPPVIEDAGGDIAPPADLIEEKKKEERAKKVEDKSERKLQYELRDDYDAEERTPLGEDITPAPSPPAAIPDYSRTESLAIAQSIAKDYKRTVLSDKFLEDASVFNNLSDLLGKFVMVAPEKRSLLSDAVVKEYRNVLNLLNQRYGTSGATLSQIVSARDAQANVTPSKVASDQLEVTSQAFLKKWLGKTKHQLSLFDKSSSYRLDIYKMAEDLRKTLDQIMNLLEKDMNVSALDPLVSDGNRKMTTLRSLMRALYYSTQELSGKGLSLR